MTNYPEQLFSALRGVILSDRERTNIRLAIQAHMREHPLEAPLPMRVVSSFSRSWASFAHGFNTSSFGHPAFAALALVLCVGVGTSYAATSALPGEPLYAFKTRVNEQVQGVLAITPQAKAEWSAELVERRLEEAEDLAVSGKLSPVATAAIESGVEYAMANFDTSIKRLSDSDDTADVAGAQSDFEASLNAHETVLVSLPSLANNDVTPIVALVHEHAEKVSNSRFQNEVSLATKDDASVRKAALGKQKSAKKQLKQAAAFSAAVATGTPDASAMTFISKEAQNDIDTGESEAKSGRWGKAYGAFQSAARKLKETKTSVDARERLRAQLSIQAGTSTSTPAVTTTTVATTTDAVTQDVEKKEDSSGKSGKDESKKDDSEDSGKKIDVDLKLEI